MLQSIDFINCLHLIYCQKGLSFESFFLWKKYVFVWVLNWQKLKRVQFPITLYTRRETHMICVKSKKALSLTIHRAKQSKGKIGQKCWKKCNKSDHTYWLYLTFSTIWRTIKIKHNIQWQKKKDKKKNFLWTLCFWAEHQTRFKIDFIKFKVVLKNRFSGVKMGMTALKSTKPSLSCDVMSSLVDDFRREFHKNPTHCSDVILNCQVSTSPTFYEQLLCAQIPKGQKIKALHSLIMIRFLIKI